MCNVSHDCPNNLNCSTDSDLHVHCMYKVHILAVAIEVIGRKIYFYILVVCTALSYHSSLGCNKVVARQDKRFLLQPCYNLLHTKLQSSITTFGDLADQMC